MSENNFSKNINGCLKLLFRNSDAIFTVQSLEVKYDDKEIFRIAKLVQLSDFQA